MSPKNPVWLAVASMVSVQVCAAISVPLFDILGVTGTIWLRLVFGALALLAFARPRGLDRRQLGGAAALGAVMATNMLLFASATHRIPLGVAVAIEFCGPLAVAAFGRGSQRGLLARSAWPLLALAGVVLLTRPWTIEDGDRAAGSVWLGLGCAAAAGVGWAFYIMLMAHVGRRVQGLQGLAVALPVAALLVAPAGAPRVLHAASEGQWSAIVTAALAALLLPLGSYVLEFLALRRMPEHVFGTWMSVEPAFGALAGLALLAQPIALLQLPGFAFVVVAGVATQRAANRRARGGLPSSVTAGSGIPSPVP